MNESLDLIEILAGCPLKICCFHSLYGNVFFNKIDLTCEKIYFSVGSPTITNLTSVSRRGTFDTFYDGECIIFPSRVQRDWSKFVRFWVKQEPEMERFDINTLQPFDKILSCNLASNAWDKTPWVINFFSCRTKGRKWIDTIRGISDYVIPYNDETKHLVGTTDDCPEYYKWWKNLED